MRSYPYVPSMVQAITVLTVLKMMTKAQTSCGSGNVNGKIMYERLPNTQLQGFDDDVYRDTAPPFMVLEKCQDLCLRDRSSSNIVRTCTSFDFQPGSRIATYNGGPEYEESICYLTREQAAPEGIGNLMLVPNSVHFTEVCITAPRPDRECPNRRYIFERHPRKKLKLPSADLKEITASNRSECEDKCLSEFSFVCRSATFDSVMRTCTLSRFTRRTHPELLEDDPSADYLENTCLSAERRCDGLAVFIKEENKRLGGPFEVDLFTNITLEECQAMCVRAEKYFCRSVEYDEMIKQCTLSEEDSISQKDDLGVSSSPSHHFYDFACLDSPRGSEYPDNSVTSHLFTGKRPDTAFQRYRNSRLGGEHHSEISGRSLSECLDECLRQPSFQCRSAVYSERYRTCRLSRYNQRDGMRIIYDADYDYYENLMHQAVGGEMDGGGQRPSDAGGNGGDRFPGMPSRPRPGGTDRYHPSSGGNGGRYPPSSGGRYPPAPGDWYPADDSRYPPPGGRLPWDRFPPSSSGGDGYDDRGPISPPRYPLPPGHRYPSDYPRDRYPHERLPDFYPVTSPEGYPGPPDRRYPIGPPPDRNKYDDRYGDNRIGGGGDDRYGGKYGDRYPYDGNGRDRYPSGDRNIPGDRYPSGDRYTPGDRYPSGDRNTPGERYPSGDRYTPGERYPSGDRYAPGDRYSPGDRYTPGDRYPSGDRYTPGDRSPSGDRHTPGNRYPSGDRYAPGDRYPSGDRYTPEDRDRYSPGSRYPSGDGDRSRYTPGDRYTPRDRFPSGERYSPGDRYDGGGPFRDQYQPNSGNRYDDPYDRHRYSYYGDEQSGGSHRFFRPNRGPNRAPSRPPGGYPPGGDRRPFDVGIRPISPGPDGPIYDGGSHFSRPIFSRCEEGEDFKQIGTKQRIRRDFVLRFVTTPSLQDCQHACLEARDFVCRSFNFREGPPLYEDARENCELSDRDTRDVEVGNPQFFENTGNFDFYERSAGRQGVDGGECLDVSQVCNEDGMEFTLRTPEGFYGRIYTYGYYDRCFFRGNGGTVNVLRISASQGYPECGTQRYGDTMTNIAVVQFSDYVQTGKDKRFNLTCLFRGPGEAIVSSGFIGAGSGSPIPIEYLPAENTLSSKVRLLILYQGRPTTTIAVGDPLTFRLEAQEGYNYITDIFATNVVARDPYSGRSVQLIDRFGCPVDSYVFPELDRGRSGDTLEANFNAFKIPESNYLVFEATVRTCREGCQPAYCQSGSGRQEPSFGRRRRDVNQTLAENGTFFDASNSDPNDTSSAIDTIQDAMDPDKDAEAPEYVREMIEVFESREELQQEARRAIPVSETVCITPHQYQGLISAVIALGLILITVCLICIYVYRRYWSTMRKNLLADHTSSHMSSSYPTRSSGITIFGTGFRRPFSGLGQKRAFSTLSDSVDCPQAAPGGPFEDPSEPIYTDPSLFERSRSLRSIAVSQKRRPSPKRQH